MPTPPSPAPFPATVHLWWWTLPPELAHAEAGARSRWVWSQVRPRLAALAGIDPAALQVTRSANGKPQVPGLGSAFSLAHDDDVALLAVGAVGQLGVDVMGDRPFASARRLARRIYTAHELAQWEAQDPAQQAQQLRTRFCTIEAVVKALDWRLWSALGNIHFLRQGRIARVPLKRAQLHLAGGRRGASTWAIASEGEVTECVH
ncbi:MAG: 4'-phosphopantetheinyl transferase superfamily protein, partial [Rhodanobacteraceae bacterium]|nr:4'-phosphopantetheinyl transferase superfamily protein [Rhodanobacteraceae bacterium]